MSSSQPENGPSPQPTFEQALGRLETIVQELEEGQIGLAAGLARYEEGIKLLRQCYQLLDHAQRRIELLNRVDLDGQEECEPFEENATSLDEKAQQRGRRRSRSAPADPGPPEDEIDGPGRLF
ncbi:MAG: exodeoxyribonuclease VII small subunit [Pirellulales bacterium]